MSPENKQRIVGIIVLIAFAILLIPFLFTNNNAGKRHKTVIDDMPLSPDRRQTINQQFQNINNNTNMAPTTPTTIVSDNVQTTNLFNQSDEKNQNLPNELTQTTIDNQSIPNSPAISETNSILPVTNEQPAETNNLVQATKVTPETQTTQSKSKISVANKTIVKPTVKKTSILKAAKPKQNKPKNTTKNPTKKEFWSVQLGSFSNQVIAQKLITTLQTNGYHVFTQKITSAKSNKVLTRILVARETDKEKATKLMQQLTTTLKLKGCIVRT